MNIFLLNEFWNNNSFLIWLLDFAGSFLVGKILNLFKKKKPIAFIDKFILKRYSAPKKLTKMLEDHQTKYLEVTEKVKLNSADIKDLEQKNLDCEKVVASTLKI